MEHRVMIDVYNSQHNPQGGTYSSSLINSVRFQYGRLENFDMRTVPYDIGTQFYSGDRTRGWFLSGLFWDLYDTNDDPVRRFNNNNINLNNGNMVENVEGDIKPIFDLLTGSVNGATNLKNSIKQSYPQISLRVDHLFSLYGY